MDSLKALWGKLRGEKKEDKEDDKKKKKDKGEKKEEKEVKSGKKEEKGKEGKEEKKEKKSPSDKKEKKEKKEKEEKKEKKNHEESDAKEKKKKEKKVDETGETKTKEVKIPNEYHKYIVGTKGAVIQELEKKTGARIQVPRAEDDSDIITLEGTASQVREAKKEIEEIYKSQKKEREERDGYDLEKETAETEKLYQKYQKEVDKQAELRGKYFEESKKAYEDGDKAKAKELSDKGHHHSHLMEEAQKKASKEIFKAKNKKYKDNLTIDLHGLHKEDALQFLEERLELVKNEKGKQLCVIYGAGIHSNEGGPVIKPAVEELIKKRGLETEEQSHGSVLVNIK